MVFVVNYHMGFTRCVLCIVVQGLFQKCFFLKNDFFQIFYFIFDIGTSNSSKNTYKKHHFDVFSSKMHLKVKATTLPNTH